MTVEIVDRDRMIADIRYMRVRGESIHKSS